MVTNYVCYQTQVIYEMFGWLRLGLCLLSSESMNNLNINVLRVDSDSHSWSHVTLVECYNYLK